MLENRMNRLIIGALGFYFGWMLAVPFYGPISAAAMTPKNTGYLSLTLVFAISHAISFLLAGIGLKRVSVWRHLMKVSLLITLVANMLLFANIYWIAFASMVVMGLSSSVYILGWGVLYTSSVKTQERLKLMASIIITANLILLLFNFIGPIVTTTHYYSVALVPLFVALLIQIQLSRRLTFKAISMQPTVKGLLPKHGLVFLFLFIFSIYLNGGFMYRIMLPVLKTNIGIEPYYPFVIYILVLIIVYRMNGAINHTFMIYLGISLLGLSFVSFALLGQYSSGYIMTIGLIEAAFALLDLFLWITLGFLAFEYGKPYKIFGIVLCANTASIVVGDLISQNLTPLSENIYVLIALLSAASIFVAILVLPGLLRILDFGIPSKILEEKHSAYDILLERLPSGISLTEREAQVIELALKGITNKAIAKELFISEHTIKTHLRNIYGKFGVTGKKELLYLALKREV